MYALILTDKTSIFYIRMFKTVKAATLEVNTNEDIINCLKDENNEATLEKVTADGSLEAEYKFSKSGKAIKISEFGWDWEEVA